MAAKESPGRQSLIYHPSKVSWATAEFIRRSPSWVARAYIYVLILFLVVGVTYSALTKIAIYVEGRGNLVTEKAIFPVQVETGMRVAKLNVKKNQLVKKGDVLLVSDDQLEPSDVELIKNDIAKTEGLLQRDLNGSCSNCLAELKSFQDRAFKLRTNGSFKENVTQLHDLLREWSALKGQQEKSGSLIAGLRRQIRLSEEKLKQIREQKAEDILAPQVEQFNSEITSAKAQIAERKQNLDNQIQSVHNRLTVRLSSLPATLEQHLTQNKVVAPIDGVVSELKISGAGQLVNPGQDLIEIIPSGTKLVAELKIANKDISEVRSGMETKVKLDALPEREYGSVNGVVSVVPPNITPSSDPNAPSDYRVVVELPSQELLKDGRTYPFKLGMAMTGMVVTKRESLLRLGIRKLLNIKDNLLEN